MAEPIKKSFKQGWELFKDSFIFLFKHPIFLGPILVAWVAIAGMVLGTRYYLLPQAENMTLGTVLLIVAGILFVFTYIIVFANTIMLEFMERIESGEKPTWTHALFDTFLKNAIKLIPIAIIWSFILFLILIIRALAKRSSERSGRVEPSIQDAAQTLSGMNASPFSWLKFGLRMFEKLVRMSVFLSLPAIAWENKGSFSSLKKAVVVIKKHPVQFLSSYALTGIAAALLTIPLIPVAIAAKADIPIPQIVWLGVIIYSGLTWALGVYLEQMSVGLLYLWHYKWEKAGGEGDLTNITKPDLLDDIHELK